MGGHSVGSEYEAILNWNTPAVNWTYTSDTEVLSLSGAAALAWYRTVQDGSRSAAGQFDWHGLAQGAALRARLNEGSESLAWARLCIDAYQSLAEEFPLKSYDASEMYCRAAMIEKHGAIPDHELLDPVIVFDWFRRKLPTDYDGARALIGRLWDEKDDDFQTAVVGPLRDIKNRLTVVKALPEICQVPDDVTRFVQLYGELP